MRVIASSNRVSAPQGNGASRRAAIIGAIALPLVPSLPSLAASKTCAADDGECRTREIAAERAKKGDQTYSDASNDNGKLGSIQYNVPVAQLGDAYAKETIALMTAITTYLDAADPYQPERINAIKTIKTDGAKWVSKYARGGSARTFSAREGYIVVDAVLGHLASNGLAALPQRKAQKVREDIARTYGFLNEKK